MTLLSTAGGCKRLGMDCLQEGQARLVFDYDSNTIDMGAKHATNMKHNQKLVLPHPRPPAKEAVLGACMDVRKEAAMDYTRTNCSPDGTQMSHNINTDERVGLAKLSKGVKSGQIIVLSSDNGNIFTVSGVESFARQDDAHTSQDTKGLKDECPDQGAQQGDQIGSQWW